MPQKLAIVIEAELKSKILHQQLQELIENQKFNKVKLLQINKKFYSNLVFIIETEATGHRLYIQSTFQTLPHLGNGLGCRQSYVDQQHRDCHYANPECHCLVR